ncbi:MAG: hypothetical protein IPG12_07915 [Saprospiraceae bacterium]|nr:hypothetical protein [Saprospiraceae bacterium]
MLNLGNLGCQKRLKLTWNQLFVIFLMLFLTACNFSFSENEPDVSQIQANIKLVRFEKELFNLDSQNLNAGVQSLIQKYPAFSNLYFIQLTQLTDKLDTIRPEFLNQLKAFLRDSLTLILFNKSQIEFSDDDELLKELKKSVKYLKYYFPNETDPVFYTLLSNFGYGNFIFSESQHTNGIGIGLEFFLGTSFDYKYVDPKNPVFSNYLTRSFNKEHLLKKSFEAFVEDQLAVSKASQFLDFIIQNGKKLYILSKIIPGIQDTVLFEFTPAQLNWCNQNKVEIWSYFLDQNLLYSTELLKFKKYVSPSPTSPGMPDSAPGQTGNYIGYHIVLNYVKNHPGLKPGDLLKLQDSQQFLKDSKFKPRNE